MRSRSAIALHALLDQMLDAAGYCVAVTVCPHGVQVRCELEVGHAGPHEAEDDDGVSRTPLRWDQSQRLT